MQPVTVALTVICDMVRFREFSHSATIGGATYFIFFFFCHFHSSIVDPNRGTVLCPSARHFIPIA